jgi:hypothetical protein
MRALLPSMLSLSALLSLGLSGCTSDVMLGRACGDDGCQLPAVEPLPKQWPTLDEPDDPCSMQLATSPHSVPPSDDLDRCQLFSLDAFSAPRGGVFLTGAELLMTPPSHHVEVRIAAEVPGYGNGEVPCSALLDESIEWFPLLSARGEWDHWDFSAAPFPVTSQHRVVINHHYTNGGLIPANKVGVKLNLHCTDVPPERISESFSFEVRELHELGPGQSVDVVGEAFFEEAVGITSLFRRTHLIERFAVERLDADGGAWPIWAVTAAGPWTLEPPEPIMLEAGARLRFACSYENPDFAPVTIGGSSSDACALLGTFERPFEP